MNFDINTIADICRPHNEKLIAEGKARRFESDATRLRRILKLIAESTFDANTRATIEAELGRDVEGGWRAGQPLPDRPV